MNHVIEAVDGDFAAFDGLFERRAEGVAAGHLDVESGEGCFGGALRATPVRDDEPFEAEIFLEDVGEGVGVLAGVGAVDAVVGAHDGAGARIPKCDLEGEEVALAHGALADDGVGDDAAGILIVDGEMLDVGDDVEGFFGFEFLASESAGEQWVFALVLEGACRCAARG